MSSAALNSLSLLWERVGVRGNNQVLTNLEGVLERTLPLPLPSREEKQIVD